VNIYTISPLLASIAIFLTGLFVFLRNPANKVFRIFFFSNAVIALWIFGCFGESNITHNMSFLLVWDRFLNVFAVFSPAAFVHVIFAILGIDEKEKKVLFANYGMALLLAILVFTDLYSPGIRSYYGVRYITIPGPLYYFFILLLCWCGYLTISRALYSVMRSSSAVRKLQSQYLLLAIVIIVVAALNYFMMTFNLLIPPIDNWLNVVYGFVMAYAITRYRLMDIDVIIRRGMLYTATTAVVAALYVSAIYGSRYLLLLFPGASEIWFMLPAIFVLALLFQPIKNRLQDLIDRNFFKTKYEGDKIAHRFSEGVKKLMKTKELAEYISRSAMQTFKLFGAACFIYNEEKGAYVCEDGRGSMASLNGAELPGSLEMAARMKKTGHLIVAEELQFAADRTRRLKKEAGADIWDGQNVTAEMKRLGAVIAVPSISKKKDYRLIAFLVAGGKKSEDAFSGSDINLLENLAGQVAISIENAMLYREQLKAIEKSMSIEKLADLGKATAGVAGEAQSALSYIEWFSNQLAEKKNDTQFLTDQARALFTETEKMKLLMQGVLEYSRPSPLKIEKVPAKKTVEDIAALMQEAAGKQGIGITISCDEGLEISADKNGLKQVLLNLLMNAVEAAGQGGKVEIRALEEEGRPVIYVSDTGPGIPEQVRQRMFEPFYTTKEHGIGLGLSIVDQSLKAMGGAITFESGPGGGTTVKIELKR
jgi:signal transduction histidine kinase